MIKPGLNYGLKSMPHFKGMPGSSWGKGDIIWGIKTSLGSWNLITWTIVYWVHVFSQLYLLYPLGHPASLTSLWEESLSPGFPLHSTPVLLLSLCLGHLLPAAVKFPELCTHGSLMPTPDSSASPSRKHWTILKKGTECLWLPWLW